MLFAPCTVLYSHLVGLYYTSTVNLNKCLYADNSVCMIREKQVNFLLRTKSFNFTLFIDINVIVFGNDYIHKRSIPDVETQGNLGLRTM